MKEKTKRCLSRLMEIFGVNNVKISNTGRIKSPCPVCETSKLKLSFDIDIDAIKCFHCDFRAHPIDLFLDAYSADPTGDLLESDLAMPKIMIINKR